MAEKRTPRPGGARTLKPGNVYVSKTGELYTYLGYYDGQPWSFYPTPDQGYLYMFYNNITFFAKSLTSKPDPKELQLDSTDITQNILGRLNSSFDGNTRYTKRPIAFEACAGHIDLTPVLDKVQRTYGLIRLGDRKPYRR